MKKTTRQLIALTCLAAFVTGSVLWAAGKEEKTPRSSAHSSDKVKPADLPGFARISFQQATLNAVAAMPGAVLKGELEIEDGHLMYSFEVVGTDKKITEVEIDAVTGKLLDTEDEENEKDDEKK